MPHARHGGRGVCGPADVTSKFDGTGFEKVQIGHIQVALDTGGAAAGWKGLEVRETGDVSREGDEERDPNPEVDSLLLPNGLFTGLG